MDQAIAVMRDDSRPRTQGAATSGTWAERAPAGDESTSHQLNGIPAVDFPSNLQAAIAGGSRMGSVLPKVIALRRGPGKLTPNEYFYYRRGSRASPWPTSSALQARWPSLLCTWLATTRAGMPPPPTSCCSRR